MVSRNAFEDVEEEDEGKQGPSVFGLDLSLRAPAWVFLPPNWNPRDPWRGVTSQVVQMKKADEDAGAKRLDRIVRTLEDFIETRWPVWAFNPPRVFVEQHAFGMATGAYALERAELVGAVKVMVMQRWSVETIPIVASGARKLLFGPQKRMTSKEWKQFIAARFAEMNDAPAWGEDERDAFVIANSARHLLGRPCLAFG
jgi:hypothetical protein